VICSFVAGRPAWAIGVVSCVEATLTCNLKNNSNYF